MIENYKRSLLNNLNGGFFNMLLIFGKFLLRKVYRIFLKNENFIHLIIIYSIINGLQENIIILFYFYYIELYVIHLM